MEGAVVENYRVGKKLFADSEGAVYLAEASDGKADAAIRFLSNRLSDNASARAAFLDQAKRLLGLRHPNLARGLAVGELEGRPFYLSRTFPPEKTLAARIEQGPLEPTFALSVIREAADGLAEAHGAGVVHGRIRPERIGLGDRTVALFDFVFAVPGADAAVDPGGAPCAYASPERCSDGRADLRGDLWSLTAALYAALAGRPPFEGPYAAALIYTILNEDPPPIDGLAPDLRPGVEALLERGLAKNPQQRFRHAAEMSEAIGRLLDASPDMATSISAPAFETSPSRRVMAALEPNRPSRRRWVLGGLGAAAAAALAAVAFRSPSAPRRDSAGRAALAVLPLRDLSAAPDQDFLTEGLTEELITSIAQIEAIRVISRTSVMQYKGREAPLSEIADALDVGYVVEGSVQRQGDRIRVNATLIDVETGQSLWAENYDHDLTDILALQSDVAKRIAAEVEVKMTPEEEGRLSSRRTVRAQSYDKYLRARYLLNRRTRESLSQARDLFQTVAAEDPRFAPAFVGMADAHILLAIVGAARPAELWPLARREIQTALDLDPELAEAYSTRALVRSFWDWRWEDAELDYRTAIELNPGDAVARQRHAVLLSRLGRHHEALEEIERARVMDPLSPTINHSVGALRFMARRFDEAIERFEKNIRTDSNRYRPYRYLGRCHLEQRDYDKAIANLRTAVELSGGNAFVIAELVYGLGIAGQTAEATERLAEIGAGGGYVSPSSWAVAYLGLGDRAQALTWLERAVDDHSSLIVWMKVEPMFDPVREDPRFQALLDRVRLA